MVQPCDRRIPVPKDCDLALPWPVRLGHGRAMALTVGMVAATALVDALTGKAIWLGPVYLLAAAFAAGTGGWRAGAMTGLACIALAVRLNGIAGYSDHPGAAIGDFALRICVMAGVIALSHRLRVSFLAEWRRARTDPLTGALNRAAFFESLGTAPARGWDLFAYADLDGLKQLNDREGHAAGDAAIVALAARLREAIRADDRLIRLGGDEFLVHLRVRDEQAGQAVARRLHAAINARGGPFGLRCSLGALICPPGPRSIDQALRHADALMYIAKRRGGGLEMVTAQDNRQGSTAQEHPVRPPLVASVQLRPPAPRRPGPARHGQPSTCDLPARSRFATQPLSSRPRRTRRPCRRKRAGPPRDGHAHPERASHPARRRPATRSPAGR